MHCVFLMEVIEIVQGLDFMCRVQRECLCLWACFVGSHAA